MTSLCSSVLQSKRKKTKFCTNLKKRMGQWSQSENVFPTFFASCAPTTSSVSLWPLRTQMCPFALFFFSSTLNQSLQNLYQWHVKLHEQQTVLSSVPEFIFLQTFTYLFKSHRLTAAIVLYSSLKIQSFPLWPPFPFICPFSISFLHCWLKINDYDDANNYGSYDYYLLSVYYAPGPVMNYWHSEISFNFTNSH